MRDHNACLECGEPFPDDARVDRKYCDRRCNNRHYKKIRRGKATSPAVPDPVATLAQMTPQQLGWVAGIVEGEGSISVNQRRRYSGNTYTYPLVCVGMADEDVVRRLQEWTGVGRVTGPHLPPVRAAAGHKPQWQWNVNNIATVEALMEALWPLLGERRRVQVSQVRSKVAERTLLRGQ